MSFSDPSSWLDQYGDVLFGYALKRVRRREVAEDLVQDTLLAAIRQASSFDGRSELQTWLVGILRHKIVDHYRRESVRKAEPIHDDEPSRGAFTPQGTWRALPGDWASDPAGRLDTAELQAAIDDCRQKLPPLLASAYTLREIDQISVDEACHLLQIGANHLAVRLYRARMLLRDCVGKYLAA